MEGFGIDKKRNVLVMLPTVTPAKSSGNKGVARRK